MSHINDSFNKLEFMQDCGLATRLLSVTTKFLVALYFACSENMNNDGYMYIFHEYSPKDEMFVKSRNYDDDETKLLSTLFLMSKYDKSYILRYINRTFINLNHNQIKFLRNLTYRDQNSRYSAYHRSSLNRQEFEPIKNALRILHTNEFNKLYLKAFSSVNYPLNIYHLIDKSIFINPSYNDKVNIQGEHFILESYISKSCINPLNIIHDLNKYFALDTLRIPHEYKHSILIDLDNLYHINEATLFRDNYYNVSRYLNGKIIKMS